MAAALAVAEAVAAVLAAELKAVATLLAVMAAKAKAARQWSSPNHWNSENHRRDDAGSPSARGRRRLLRRILRATRACHVRRDVRGEPMKNASLVFFPFLESPSDPGRDTTCRKCMQCTLLVYWAPLRRLHPVFRGKLLVPTARRIQARRRETPSFLKNNEIAAMPV